MQRPRLRLEIRGIMAVIAITALVIGVYRVDAAPSVAVVLVLGATSALAYKRFSDVLNEWVKEERESTQRQRIKLGISSVIVAVTLIGLSDAAFLAGYFGFVEIVVPALYRFETDRGPMAVEGHLAGIFCGFLLAMTVAYGLKPMIWPVVMEPHQRVPSRSEEICSS